MLESQMPKPSFLAAVFHFGTTDPSRDQQRKASCLCLRAICLCVLLVLCCGPRPAVASHFLIGFLPAVSENAGETRYIVGALTYAVDQVNADPTLLAGHKLNFSWLDSKGDSKVSIRHIIRDYCDLGVDAFIGPEDACRTEALIASAINLPMIAYKCRDSEVLHSGDGSFRDKYPTFARTVPSTAKVSKSVIALMQKYGWRSCTILQQDSHPWREAGDTLERLAERHDIRINDKKQFAPPPDSLGKMVDILHLTYQQTRIYVFLGDYHLFLDFVRSMEKEELNKNGEHLVIMVHEKPFDPQLDYMWIQSVEAAGGTSPAETVPAMRSVLMILPRNPTSRHYPDFLNHTLELSMQAPFHQPRIPPALVAMGIGIDIPIYAAYLYDAVRLYALALNQTLSMKEDPRNGTAIIDKLRNTRYNSIQGHSIFLDDDGDSEANYTVVALKKDSNSTYGKSLQAIGGFGLSQESSLELVFVEDPKTKMEWVGLGPPLSDPPCGFQGELCRFQADWRTAVVCITVACVVAIMTTAGCRHYLYEQKLARLLWKVDFRDLLMADPDSDPTSSDKFKRKNCGRLSYLCGKDSQASAPNPPMFTRVASYKGAIVAVKVFKKRHVEVTRRLRKELQMLKETSHDNINRFVGACVDPPTVCIVTHYCARGSLKDILENEDIHLDDVFNASLVADLIKGMIYLHDSEIGCHGNLKSSNCLVDSRWVLQIADFGLHQFKVQETPKLDDDKYSQKLLYKSPELLRGVTSVSHGTQKGDVYAFGLILYEIHGRAGPWGNTCHSPREIIERLKTLPGPSGEVFRPDTSSLNCRDFVISCMQECWLDDHELRPDFKYIRIHLKSMQKGLRSNIFDNMLAMMEKYANNLEAIVDDRTVQLLEEKKKTESLLLRMLPRVVAEQLKVGKEVVPELFQCVTIYFSDIVGFTAISAQSAPLEVVTLLNDLYTLFDVIIEEYDVYKVETIGDAYMVVSGLPIRNGDNHAGEIASMSLHLLRAIKHFRIRHKPNDTLMLRIGMHSGSCVAGVVGSKMPRYCLFGDTVNTASRIESTGDALKIHCSQECKDILTKLGGYRLQERGYVSLKGRGEKFTYFLVGEDKSARLRRLSSTASGSTSADRNNSLARASVSSLSDTDDVEIEECCPKTVLLNGSAHFSRNMESLDLIF